MDGACVQWLLAVRLWPAALKRRSTGLASRFRKAQQPRPSWDSGFLIFHAARTDTLYGGPYRGTRESAPVPFSGTPTLYVPATP